MSQQLGTLEDLPDAYRADMAAAGVAPLWPMMRNVLPHGRPSAVTRPGFWDYGKLRPLLLRAGETFYRFFKPLLSFIECILSALFLRPKLRSLVSTVFVRSCPSFFCCTSLV